MNMKNCQLLLGDQVYFFLQKCYHLHYVWIHPTIIILKTSFHLARKRQIDSAKEVEKEIQTEEVKRRRGRVYGRQETEEQKEEDAILKNSKIHLYISIKY